LRLQIATRLRRSRQVVFLKVEIYAKWGLLEDKDISRGRPIKPDQQDFDEAKRNYCRKDDMTIAQLCAKFESDNRLAAQLYRLAQTAKLARTSGLAAAVKDNYPRRHA